MKILKLMKSTGCMLIIIHLFSCSASHNGVLTTTTYELREVLKHLNKEYDYTMSIDGSHLIAFDGKTLISYNLNKDVLEMSNKYHLLDNYNYDLVNSKTGFGILVYNLNTQYDTTSPKEVKLYEFEDSLLATDTTIFLTEKNSYLLEEDFGYVSYYKFKNNNKFVFNHRMSYMQIVQSGKWQSNTNAFSNIDLFLGEVYSVKIMEGNDLIIQGEKGNSVRLESEKMKPYHFSVANKDIILYTENKGITFARYDNGYQLKDYHDIKASPSNRLINGIFTLDRSSDKLLVTLF